MPLPTLPRQSSDDAVSLEERLRQLEARLAQLERLPAGEQVQSTDFAPLPGQIVTVEAPPAGLGVLLPTPRPQIRNARISISALNANPIRWQAVNGRVNGAALITSNAVGLVEAVCDGAAWHVSQGAASPTGSVASTSGATYFLETADTGLPNARVATDSTEIDADLTISGVVSWALKTASVVFGKLQNLTGLSVLGRAANSTGVMAAITATAARQVLRANDAGTALEWGHPVAIWNPDGTDQGDFSTLDLRQQTSIIVDGGAFGDRWQVRLKRAALTGVVEAAEDVNGTTFGSGVAGAGLSLSSGNTVLDWDGILVSQGPTGIGTFRSLDFIDGQNTTANLADAGGGVVAIAYDVDLSSVTYTAGDGLSLTSNEFSVDGSALAGAGLQAFGATLFVGAGDGIDVAADTVAVDVSDLVGTGLEADGSNNLRIAASAAGDGLTGGAGSALAVGGSTSIIVGANDVQRAALTGEVTAIQNSNATTVTRSTDFGTNGSTAWTGAHRFESEVVLVGHTLLRGLVTATLAADADAVDMSAANIYRVVANGFQLKGMVPASTGNGADGQLVLIYNADASDYLLIPNDSAGTATNGFLTPNARSYRVPPKSGAWARYDTNNNRWIILGVPLGGLLKRDEHLTNAVWSSTAVPGATHIHLIMGGGAGGGGGADADSNPEACAGAGGGSGAEVDVWITTIDDTTAITGTTGAGGSSGSAAGGNGGAGSDSTASYNSVTYTAGGGTGGTGVSAGADTTNQAKFSAPGTGGTTSEGQASHNGSTGEPGLMFDIGNLVAHCMAIGGRGAPSSRHGGGAGGKVANAAGSAAGIGGSQGSGGGGAARIATSSQTGVAGGAGGTGWAIIEWWCLPVAGVAI